MLWWNTTCGDRAAKRLGPGSSPRQLLGEGTLANAPQPGDVIIHRQIHSPAVYILSALNGSHQIIFRTYQDALDRAQRFALREHLDAWYTVDEHAFERVAQRRGRRASA